MYRHKVLDKLLWFVHKNRNDMDLGIGKFYENFVKGEIWFVKFSIYTRFVS
jgi:hypothetical protein